MTSTSPPLLLSPGSSTTIDLLNGFCYTFPSASPPSSARIAVYDPQRLYAALEPHLLPLFPLSSMVVRAKTGQATLSTVDVSVIRVDATTSSSPSTPSVSAASLRSPASWHWLPYLHLYILTTSSPQAYSKQHRLSISPFVSAFTDSLAASGSASSALPPSASASAADRLGQEAVILFLQHGDERKESKGERKVLDKLRSDWGKDAVVSAVMSDEWWAGVNVEEDANLSDSTSSVSLSSLSFFSSNPSPNTATSTTPPPLSLSLLPVLKARLLSSFAVRCERYHLYAHSLLVHSQLPHWPFPKYIVAQLSYIWTQSQFQLWADCVRLLDELKAVMEAPTVREMMREGNAGPPSSYIYEGFGDGEEEVRMWRGDVYLIDCERLVYARLADVLRKQGKVEEVIERGEQALMRWLETEVGHLNGGWSTWGWLIGAAVDVWSRGEREIRERHEVERKRGDSAEDRKKEKVKEAADDGVDSDVKEKKKDEAQAVHRGSSFLRVLSPERGRKEREKEAEAQRKKEKEKEREKQMTERRTQDDRDKESKKKDRRLHHSLHSSNSSAAHPRRDSRHYQLTHQIRHLLIDKTNFLFVLITRLLSEWTLRMRANAALDLLEDGGIGGGEARRVAVMEQGEERRWRMEEWRQLKGEELVLSLDEEVSTAEMYVARQERINFCLLHPPLFPLLLHSLLYFTSAFMSSPSSSAPLHSEHFLTLHARLFSALALPSFSSSVFLHLSSLHFAHRWYSLSLHFLLLRLREELSARRFSHAAQVLALLIAVQQQRWVDVSLTDVSVRLADWPSPSPGIAGSANSDETAQRPCCSAGPSPVPTNPAAVAALLRHVCEAHLHGVEGGEDVSDLPPFHFFRALVPRPVTPLSLPLPRPSIPSPAGLTSLLRRPAMAVNGDAGDAQEGKRVVGPILVASLSSFFTFTDFSIRLCPFQSPLLVDCQLTFTSLLHSLDLDDVALTLRVERDDEALDIDLEYHDIAIQPGEQTLSLTATLIDTTHPTPPSSPTPRSCELHLGEEDYGLLLSLLTASSPSSTASVAVVELAHLWFRFSRLHLLWWDRSPVQQLLSITIDSTAGATSVQSATSPALSSPSAASRVTISLPSTARPFHVGGNAEILLLVQAGRAVEGAELTLQGADVIDAVTSRLADGSAKDELPTPVRNARVVLGDLLLSSSLLLHLLVRPPLPRSFSHPSSLSLALRLTGRMSSNEGSVADVEVQLMGRPPFAVSSSVSHLGHRLFVSLILHCSCEEEGTMYRIDDCRVEWSSRWRLLSCAEEEVSGVMLEGGSDLSLIFEVEDSGDGERTAEAPDGLLCVRCSISSLSVASSLVTASYPISFPPSSLLPPDLHVIMAAPSTAVLGALFPLSVTVLLSSSSSLVLPLTVLCEVVDAAAASFLYVGLTCTVFDFSSSSSSHTLTLQLMPLTAGLVHLPDIRLRWKERREGERGAVESREADGDEWVDVEEQRVKRHFGQERVQVEPRGHIRCDLRLIERPATEEDEKTKATDEEIRQSLQFHTS